LCLFSNWLFTGYYLVQRGTHENCWNIWPKNEFDWYAGYLYARVYETMRVVFKIRILTISQLWILSLISMFLRTIYYSCLELRKLTYYLLRIRIVKKYHSSDLKNFAKERRKKKIFSAREQKKTSTLIFLFRFFRK